MFYTKQKAKKTSIFLIAALIVLIINAGIVSASSYSSNFSVNDEAVDFSYNADYLNSTSYAMDLGTISWTDRLGESTSYKIIDANSELNNPVTPPTPGGGGTGGIAGGRVDQGGDIDNANLISLETDYQYQNYLHNSADEADSTHNAADSKEHKANGYTDDNDGCSFHFERKFLRTNPSKNDTDGDGIEDCDEALVYGMSAIDRDENDDHVGLAKAEDFIITQHQPLFVGRVDFGTTEVFKQHPLIQIEINKLDPITLIGTFFMSRQKDYNFAEILDFEFEDGIYESKLLFGGMGQEFTNVFVIDSTIDYVPLEVNVSDNGQLEYDSGYVHLAGKTGNTYGVVALWKHQDFVDVSATVAGIDGVFSLYSPEKLIDGEYEIIIYALDKRDGQIIQTNYQHINIEIKDNEIFIINKAELKEVPRWTAALDHLHATASEVAYLKFKNIEYKNNFMYLVSFGVFLSISILTFLTLCREKSV